MLYLTARLVAHILPCSHPPPHLHSFPTRRSSDLPTSCRPPRSTPPRTSTCARTRSRTRQRRPGKARSTPRDRKSTRLNSSHVRISYAVFCLQKQLQLCEPSEVFWRHCGQRRGSHM